MGKWNRECHESAGDEARLQYSNSMGRVAERYQEGQQLSPCLGESNRREASPEDGTRVSGLGK